MARSHLVPRHTKGTLNMAISICKAHWKSMRKKVDDVGLTFLVAKSAEESVQNMQDEIDAIEDGRVDESKFDPLMSMYWEFTARVMETIGMSVMFTRGDEDDGMPKNVNDDSENCYCPLCIVRRDFNHHNTPTGMCGDPECDIRVQQGEIPWDEQWIEEAGNAMFKHAVKTGLVKVQ